MHNLYLRLAPWLLTIIEGLLVAVAVAFTLLSSRKFSDRKQQAGFRWLEGQFALLARHKRLSVFLVGASVIVIRVALVPVLGVPQPRFHDEFSYLLAADTFAHGRLTNPTHPMWIHFESFHIIEKPTYMSMYPPAQGLALAAGQVLGSPWVGQMLITAVMCAALCWMLQGWLPPTWALMGASLAVIRLGLLSYWMNTYWCASVAGLGGALVLGAWPRMRKHLRICDALLLAIGLAILANSRPFEGFVFSIPVALAMALWLLGKRRPGFRQSFWRVVTPICFILLIAAAATGYYYHRLTGDAFRTTYRVNRDTYSMAPYFIWQAPRPAPEYHNATMQDFYWAELRQFERNRTLPGYLLRSADKIFSWWQFYLGPLLTLPLLALPAVIRQRKMHLPLLICGFMFAGFAVETWTMPHYFAPATAALYLLLVQCMRYLWHWKSAGRPLGKSLVRMVPLLACSMILLRIAALGAHVAIEPPWPRGDLQRSVILNELEKHNGRQLVIVHYEPNHNPEREWVYNDADIDGAKIIWARDMGEAANQELLQYFRERNVFVVDADSNEPFPKALAAR